MISYDTPSRENTKMSRKINFRPQRYTSWLCGEFAILPNSPSFMDEELDDRHIRGCPSLILRVSQLSSDLRALHVRKTATP